jgi:hypothetical protein
MSSSCMYLCACHSPRGIAYGADMTPAPQDSIPVMIADMKAMIAECLAILEADDLNPAGDAFVR